jgi:TRAP-type C4-dicarboxylate transport system permease small subunit
MREGTGRVLDAAARALALAGGVLLLAAGLLTVASVAGRALVPFGFTPLKGDFELVSMACAVAVFSFLPWCQLRRGHVTVDIVVGALPPRARAAFGLAGDLVMTAVSVLILWRLWIAFGERLPFFTRDTRAFLGWGARPFFPERSAELGIALWIPYAACVAGATLFVIACIYTVWRSAAWTLAGHEGRA